MWMNSSETGTSSVASFLELRRCILWLKNWETDTDIIIINVSKVFIKSVE
jgi:hypothetical protein